MDDWTVGEVETLERMYNNAPVQEISATLNRSAHSIYHKVRRLGFSGRWHPLCDYSGLSESQKGWIAGIIDGEGWIGIDKRSRRATIQVNNTCPAMIDQLFRYCGGSIYPTKRKQPHHKDVWTWVLSRRANVIGLLAVIGPFLVAKKEAAYRAVQHVSGSKETT